MTHLVAADPCPSRFGGTIIPAGMALIIIDMQTDCCGFGGCVGLMGYGVSLTPAPARHGADAA